MASKHILTPVLRARLASRPANGHTTFIPQIRKLVFEYCNHWPSSLNTRTFLLSHLEHVARSNPHVEIVVRQRNNKQPIIRGFYLNNNEKVVSLNGFEVNGIEKKVQLLLDSSGAKILPLKRKTVVSTTESARGIWSGLHDQPYRI